MSNIKGEQGELRATIHITRKDTGKVETYEIKGGCTREEAEALGATVIDGTARYNRNHGAAGAVVGEGSKLSTKEH